MLTSGGRAHPILIVAISAASGSGLGLRYHAIGMCSQCAVLNCGAGVPIKAPDRVGMGCNAGSEGTNSPATTVIGVVPLNVNCIKPAVSSLSCRGVCIHRGTGRFGDLPQGRSGLPGSNIVTINNSINNFSITSNRNSNSTRRLRGRCRKSTVRRDLIKKKKENEQRLLY